MTAHERSVFLPETVHRRTRDVVVAALEARPDPAKYAQCFHEDGVLHIIGRVCDYSLSGVFRGREQILNLFRRIDAEVICSERTILGLVIEDGKAALRRSVVVRHRGTSASAKLIFADMVKVRGDKISEMFEYADTAWLKRLSGDED
jgi:ketosteroid isomerase-like protein